MDGYRCAAGSARVEVRDRGSRFLAVVGAAESETVAQAELAKVRTEFPRATHHCWAWRLGAAAAERSSDDGEPAGTAGMPILQVLRGAELSDVVVVVVRWFGGTKLGKGGLARAYAAATREALAQLATMEKVPSDRWIIEAPYDRIGALKRLIHPPEVELIKEEYGAQARWIVQVHRRQWASVEGSLADLGLSARAARRGSQE